MIGRRFAYWTGKALMDALRAIGYRFHYPLPISEASITHYPLSLHNLGWDQFLADLDVDDGLFLSESGLHIAHTDTYLGGWQHDTASDITNRVALGVADLVAATWDSTLLALEVHQLALHTLGLLLQQELLVDKVLGIELGDPA